MLSKIEENILNIKKKIANKSNDVKLVAVSKTFPNEHIETALKANHNIFGENKVQDFVDKYKYFKEKEIAIEWHFIGHLQSNKAKQIAFYADFFHCLDSLKLAQKLNNYCEIAKRKLKVLLQINISEEEQKHGIKKTEVAKLLPQIASLENLELCGIMAIGTFNQNPENSRKEFQELKKIFDENQEKYQLKYLSMGMSADYLIAIEEGANIVRVGSSIFGKRNYQ